MFIILNFCYHFSVHDDFEHLMITIKFNMILLFSSGLYPNPMPRWLVTFWIYVGVALVVFLTVWSWQLRKALEQKKL